MAGSFENSNPAFNTLDNGILELIGLLTNITGFQFDNFLVMYEKRSNEFIEYQHPEPTVFRSPKNDRVHPLDTVSILEFRTDHKRDIDEVFVHSGSYADELARSFNAMAITMASHIYFRSNAYNPHTEEGRKLLAHELTHVAQHTEGAITTNTTKDDLEREAEQAEMRATYEDDPIMTIEIEGERYRFRQSKMKEYAKAIADDIKDWMLQQKLDRSEESYLNLLCAYEKWIQEHS